MKQLLILLIVLIPIALTAQYGLVGDAGILYTLANGAFTESGGVNYFEFDIMAQATPEEQGELTRFGDGMIHLYYNTDAFGEDLYTHNNVEVSLGQLTTSPYPGVDFYLILLNDTAGRGGYPVLLAITLEFISNEGNGGILPATPIQLVHVKFVVQDPSQVASVCFWPNEMGGQSFYDDQWTYYNNVAVGNCIYLNPTVPVELSHFSATMTAENNVQLTWVSQTETSVLGYNVYRSADSDLSGALKVSPLIEGTNTSHAQTYIYVDEELYQDGTYYYWLQSVDIDGSVSYHGPASVVFSHGGQTASPPIPLVTKLENAYPNPFNPDTTIRYQLQTPGKVTIDIYNHKGQIVRSFSQSHAAPGYYGVNWDGRDSSGRALASGVYLYKMSSGSYSFTKKLILQK